MVTPHLTKNFDKICVLDFGGQYCHLIARRIRDLGVYTEILPSNSSPDDLKEYKGIILSGGPSSVYEENAPKYNSDIFNLNIPIFGICYGLQLMSHVLKGEVSPGKTKEYGFAQISIKDKNSLFKNLEDTESVWMSHGDLVSKTPVGFKITASTKDCPIAGMANENKKFYGVQFHPEVTHTEHGTQILQNFIDITGAQKSWNIKDYEAKIITEIKDRVKDKKVFMLLSGGVDSTVAFALLDKALAKENVYGLHIDNGFMRLNESKKVEEALKELGYNNFHTVDASSEFLKAVDGLTEPEEKRKIVGKTFLDIQKRELNKIGFNENDWLLGQGTIYPDTIESQGTENADLIKTHHNRIQIIVDMIKEGKVIEPLEYLYKDEVRYLGKNLGLPKSVIERHPFPGPGLSIRCLCTEISNLPENLEEANKKIKEITDKYNLTFKILPIKSVGVQGDARTYRHPVAIYSENIPDEKILTEISTELTNKVKEINRVLFSLTPLTEKIEAKTSFLTKERLDRLRESDDFITNLINETGEYKDIWQFPVVLVPIGEKESLVLRPIVSKEAMTASFYMLKKETLNTIKNKLQSKYSYLLYDITNKPPGTIEWE